MITYINIGNIDYTDTEPLGCLCNIGPEWQFQACLTGQMQPVLRSGQQTVKMSSRRLWAFPPEHVHGWSSSGGCERVVFKSINAPKILLELLPERGYYQVPLRSADCARLRVLAQSAIGNHEKLTELIALQDQAIIDELSLLALRDSTPRSLAASDLAKRRVNKAITWYVENMHRNPAQEDIAQAVNISVSYLRRIFHESLEMSPKEALTIQRLSTVERLLQTTELTLENIAEETGFSSASTLSRATKEHFGIGAREIRARCKAKEKRLKQAQKTIAS